MLKKDLRIKYTALRKQLSPTQIAAKSFAISNSILTLPIWSKEFYHIFLPITSKQEVDTLNIVSILRGRDKKVIVPKVFNDELRHYQLTEDTTFKSSPWGVPEPQNGPVINPENMDVVFVPMLAYDVKGNRVGYGKGFYDGFLIQCKKDVVKVGLSFFEAEPMITDVRPEDIRLDYCITPNTTYSFMES